METKEKMGMMTRVLIFGCAALLAIGLSAATFAGSITDGDGDGVPDGFDNCSTVPNGPLAATNQCNGQEDGDLDGYGNACDADVNQNGAADLADVGDLFSAAAAVSTNPVTDLNCNGATDLADVGIGFAAAAAVATPGPSGLACAGTVPCTAQ